MIAEILMCVALGQVYEVADPPVVVHRIINVENETSRVYKKIRMYDGYETTIPVINGNLPGITRYRDSQGRVTKLVLDYSYKGNFSKFLNEDVIVYKNPEDKPVQTNLPRLRSNLLPITPVKPKAPTGDLKTSPAKPAAPEPIPVPTQTKIDDKMMRPSQVTRPESDRTKVFPRYEN